MYVSLSDWHSGHWVFGGIKRESLKMFLVEVPDGIEQINCTDTKMDSTWGSQTQLMAGEHIITSVS